MKKITCYLSVLLIALFVMPTMVFADSCSSYSAFECKGKKDDKGRECSVYSVDKDGNILSTQCCTVIGTYCGYNDMATGHARRSEGSVPDFLKDDKEVQCGHIKKIPSYIPFITNLTITIFTIISMGMLAIMGTIDLFKGINSGNPDAIKKSQKAFFNRLGSALLLFFIVALTRFLVSFFMNLSGGSNGVIDCISCFINNKCS